MGARHPLLVLSKANLKVPVPPVRALDDERLTGWMADRVEMRYFTSIPEDRHARDRRDVGRLYFKRNILPVGVEWPRCDCYRVRTLTAWQRAGRHVETQHHCRARASPEDIGRVRRVHNFFQVGQRASGRHRRPGSTISNNWWGWAKPGARSMPTIITSSPWSIGYGNTHSTSAPRTSRGAAPRRGSGAFSHRRCFASGVSGTGHGLRGDDLAHQILGRMDVVESAGRRMAVSKRACRMGRGELRLSTADSLRRENWSCSFSIRKCSCDFSELGFAPDGGEWWNTLIKNPGGILLVTGPTDSGKTTTLYSTLKLLATPGVNVSTIEDPIEMVEPMFNQMQVQSNIDLTFAAGVRALMRQRPGHHHGRRNPRSGNGRNGHPIPR